MNLQSMMLDVAPKLINGEVNLRIELIVQGSSDSVEELILTVRNGRIEPDYFLEEFLSDLAGYVQISFSCKYPYFRRLNTEHAYMILRRPDGGGLIMNAAHKVANPIIVNTMRNLNEFCLSHPAHYVSASRGIGNSVFLVNPYDGPVVATVALDSTNRYKKKILPKSAQIVDLGEIIPRDSFTSVLYTGNNVFQAWDIRHSFASLTKINRVDHLEYFRGDPTKVRLPPKAWIRAEVSELYRRLHEATQGPV